MRRKLTALQRDALLADYVAGVPIAHLAGRYGIDQTYPAVLARRRGVARRTEGTSAALVERRRLTRMRIERQKRIRVALAGLDAEGRACFVRCRKGGMAISASLVVAQDDMAIRARRSRRASA